MGHPRCAAGVVPLLLRSPGVRRGDEYRADDVHDAVCHLDALFDARDVGGVATGDKGEALPEVAGGEVGSQEGVALAVWQLGCREVAWEEVVVKRV